MRHQGSAERLRGMVTEDWCIRMGLNVLGVVNGRGYDENK